MTKEFLQSAEAWKQAKDMIRRDKNNREYWQSIIDKEWIVINNYLNYCLSEEQLKKEKLKT
jgi:hypothetical protein